MKAKIFKKKKNITLHPFEAFSVFTIIRKVQKHKNTMMFKKPKLLMTYMIKRTLSIARSLLIQLYFIKLTMIE